MYTDRIEHVMQQWMRERPDRDYRPMGILGRILLIAERLQKDVDGMSKGYDIPTGGFDVLATLQRNGSPYRMSPTELYRELVLPSGSLTHRLDRLEQAGMVARHPDPDDRRAQIVELTQRGAEAINGAMDDHLENEELLLHRLTPEEQEQAAALLAKILAVANR